jgi:hypothetical protein
MLIAVACVKGAPGVSTFALGLAALWPTEGAVLVECDPAGGDLAARFGHHPDPGLASLAAACRTGAGDSAADVVLAEHAQRLRVGATVVLAPPGDSAAVSVHTLAAGGLQLLRRAATEHPVVLDLGRLERGGPGMDLAVAADLLLVVAGAGLAEQIQVQARLDWLRPQLGGRLRMVLAGGGGYRPAEIQRDLGVPVLGRLPHGRFAAGALTGQLHVPNWYRLRLARAIHTIAATLTAPHAGSVQLSSSTHADTPQERS